MDNAEMAFRNAKSLYQSRDYAAAASLLEPFADRSDHAGAVLLLGMCRLHAQAFEPARALLARAHTLAPDDPMVTLQYGVALQGVGRHREAVDHLRAAARKLPQDPAPQLNLAHALLAQSEVQGAIAAARKARLRGPLLPQAHHALGCAYLAAGCFDKAAECFRVSTRLALDFADGWVGLGVAQYRMGQIHAAKQAMRGALRAAPGHPVALANLGAFLRLTGDLEASAALLRDTITNDAQAASARINLAADFLQQDRAQDALALLDEVAPPAGEPGQEWTLQKTLALIKLGRPDEARILLDGLGEVSAELAPLLYWQRVLLAGDTPEAATQAAAMEAAMTATTASLLEHRIMLHYELGTFWSGRGDPDRAFPHWLKGHRQLQRFQPFSRAAFAEFVDASIEIFSAARLSQGARAENADPAPVFIVGMPRTGTTLAEQILSAHGQVHGAGERAALGQAFLWLGGPDRGASVQRIAGLGAAALDEQARHYLADLHAIAPGAARIIDKMPGNFRYLGLLALLLPGAKIIACERDPRDIGLSIFTHRFDGVHAYAHDLADLGWYIGQQHRLMAHWRAVLPNPVMTVNLTDWIEDFPGTLRRLTVFLELPYDAACERFHETGRDARTASRMQVREPVNRKGIGRWRHYASHLAPLIEALRESGVTLA